MFQEQFSNWLKAEMATNDISRARLAKKTGRSAVTVWRWMSCHRLPTMEDMYAIAEEIGAYRNQKPMIVITQMYLATGMEK